MQAVPQYIPAELPEDSLNLVFVGHVDHGKSTVVGRLLADTDSLPEGKLEQVRSRCAESGKQLEYAFLIDALSDEQTQGITIDAARVFFKSGNRRYLLMDAPGHIEFLKNMVTGAARADAAVLVIDAHEGIKENSRRHGYLLSLLGITQLIVLVNKMDLVQYDQSVFESVRLEYSEFLSSLGVRANTFIPVSGILGENIVTGSDAMPWHNGPALLEVLNTLPAPARANDGPLRMFVQDVYKFTRFGDNRRIIAGTVSSGTLRAGDSIQFWPSGKLGRVASIEQFPQGLGPRGTDVNAVAAGCSVGFTLEQQAYVRRGELVTRADDSARPNSSSKFAASIFWLGRSPLAMGKEYTIRLGTQTCRGMFEAISNVADAGALTFADSASEVAQNSAAQCVIQLKQSAAFDLVGGCVDTSRFVVVEDYQIQGGGIIREAIEDEQTQIRNQARKRDERWIRGRVTAADRAERYQQSPALVLITGTQASNRKDFAARLELRLFQAGQAVYFMGMGNVVHGLDADLAGRKTGGEHIRRLAEVANLLLDAGLIVIVSAADLTDSDVADIRETIGGKQLRVIAMGATKLLSVPDLALPEDPAADEEILQRALTTIQTLIV